MADSLFMGKRESPAWQKWRRIIQDQHAGGLSVTDFCHVNGIVASSFFAWKRRLRNAGPAFVEARIADSTPVCRPPMLTLPRDRRSADTIRIRLRCGRSLTVSRGFDRQLLGEVVSVLEGLS